MNNELFNDVIATNNHLWSLGKHIFLEHEIDINYILHVPFFRHIFPASFISSISIYASVTFPSHLSQSPCYLKQIALETIIVEDYDGLLKNLDPSLIGFWG